MPKAAHVHADPAPRWPGAEPLSVSGPPTGNRSASVWRARFPGARGQRLFLGPCSRRGAGTRHAFRLDDEEKASADPASRFPPERPEGPSEVVDPAFAWTDADWPGLSRRGDGRRLSGPGWNPLPRPRVPDGTSACTAIRGATMIEHMSPGLCPVRARTGALRPARDAGGPRPGAAA